MAAGQPDYVTQIRWRPAGGSFTNLTGAHNLELKLNRFSRFAGSGSGQVPGAPRILGKIRHTHQEQHEEMMSHTTVTGAANTDAEIEVTYKTTANATRVRTITGVIFVGTGDLQIGNKAGTTDKAARKLIETPFEVRMDDDDTPGDFISET